MTDTIFSPSFGNKPGKLIGRESDMKCLMEGISTRPGSKERARIIIGQRGLGKTVLLLELADYARENNYIVASPSVVATGMLDRIIEKLERDGERYFSSKTTKLTGGSVGVLGFSAGIQTERGSEPVRSFAYRLSEICEKAEEQRLGVLILVDEVQANSDELKQLIIAYQEMVGEGRNISMVFAGLPAAISRVLNDHVLTFFNRASKLMLEPISQSEITIFYRNSFEALGIKLDDETIRRLAKESKGSPYLMQLLGHYITISVDDNAMPDNNRIEDAIVMAHNDYVTDICETTLSPLSDKDVEFLKAMSGDDDKSAVKSIANRLGVESAYVQRYKTRLIQSGVIEQAGRGYVNFAVPYMREYLRIRDTE